MNRPIPTPADAPDFASDWYRLTALYSVRFELDKPVDGVALLQCVWSPDLPTQREKKLLVNKYRAALAAFKATVQQAAFEDGGAA
ncbi:MAG: hypothetical protein ACOH2M_29715 [Cypionkella sp.]